MVWDSVAPSRIHRHICTLAVLFGHGSQSGEAAGSLTGWYRGQPSEMFLDVLGVNHTCKRLQTSTGGTEPTNKPVLDRRLDTMSKLGQVGVMKCVDISGLEGDFDKTRAHGQWQF